MNDYVDWVFMKNSGQGKPYKHQKLKTSWTSPVPHKHRGPRKMKQKLTNKQQRSFRTPLRVFFFVHKATDGLSFNDAKRLLIDAGITDVQPAYSPYIGCYGISVPKQFERKANYILFR